MADNGQEVVFVNAGNNRVGIGTTSPGEVLHVAGNLEVSGNDSRVKIHGIEDSHPGLEFYEAGTRKWIIFNNYQDDSLDFKTNSNTRMVINQDGTVGIGTQSPSTTLDVNGTVNATTYQIGSTAISSTAAELNLLDASVTSEPSDGVWAVVERIAKATLDSNDWPLSSTPVSLGVTIPDNAILTKIVFDTTQTFAAGDNGSEAMSVVDFGLYNGNTQVIQFASQTMIARTGAGSGDVPYSAGVTEIFPITAGLSAKLTADLTVKFHNIDDGSGMMNNLDAGALDVFIYYIMGA